ncbi:UNVERIFIED_CONTAM: hypothetical protein Scaly_3077400 [Sesamum calycinum]|uniref:Reverse transcriptase zinc-binding domain-containing protein n=1 Tax=Sesamum calycinum TaxID=2727403 RepID=A0AAW2JTK0_9LAMI
MPLKIASSKNRYPLPWLDYEEEAVSDHGRVEDLRLGPSTAKQHESFALIPSVVGGGGRRSAEKVILKLTPSGIFTTKSAYALTTTIEDEPNLPVPNCQDQRRPPLSTNSNTSYGSVPIIVFQPRVICTTHILAENFCPHCPFETETVLHVLRDCTKAKTIWRESTPFHFHQQPPEDILTWLKTNCLNQTAHTKKIPWNTLFTFTCWHLWLQRNNHIYKRKKMSENWTLPQSLPKLPNTISYHHLPQQFANDASKCQMETAIHWMDG